MLDTFDPLHPAPALAAVPVNALLTHFATALPWVTSRFGLVQTGVDKNNQERYPQIYRQDGKKEVADVRPDDRDAARLWFEYDGPDLIDFSDILAGAGTYRFQLALVGWCHLAKIDPLRTYDFTDMLAADVLRAMLSCPGFEGRIIPERIERQAERVFERYRWEPAKHQLIFGGKFGAFRIPFEAVVEDTSLKCVAPFTPMGGW